MPVKNIYHNPVKTALKKDRWIITDEPFKLKYESRELLVHLGAKKIIAPQNRERKIMVAIKHFQGRSQIHDLQICLGRYLLFKMILEESESDNELYLSISKSNYEQVFLQSLGGLIMKNFHLPLLIFDPDREEIVQWIN